MKNLSHIEAMNNIFLSLILYYFILIYYLRIKIKIRVIKNILLLFDNYVKSFIKSWSFYY